MRRTPFNKIGAILAVLLLSIPLPEAYGEDWVLFSVSLDGRIEEYYDRETVTFPSPGIVKLTTKTVKYTFGEIGESTKGRKVGHAARDDFQVYAHTITVHRIECRNRIDTLLSSSDYDRDGKRVYHSEEPWVLPRPSSRRSPQPIYPETVSENLFKIVCPHAP
jgi:hypothetical protein